jgi:hypothetical protein
MTLSSDSKISANWLHKPPIELLITLACSHDFKITP